jgi:hypothetical protein
MLKLENSAFRGELHGNRVRRLCLHTIWTKELRMLLIKSANPRPADNPEYNSNYFNESQRAENEIKGTLFASFNNGLLCDFRKILVSKDKRTVLFHEIFSIGGSKKPWKKVGA